METMRRLLLLALLVPAAACASARAATLHDDHPALFVPPAPPRTIEPLPVEPPTIEPVADLPNTTPAAPPRPRPQREPNNKPGASDPKPESKPPETPTDPAAAGQPAAQPVPPLRTPGDPDGPEMTRQISGTIERANKMLGSVNIQTLNGDRRANYDNAKSFIKQAEDALKVNNLIE